MMNGGGNSTFIDTNILIYAAVPSSTFHTEARTALEAYRHAGVEMWISRQILREYLAALTRPQTYANPIPIATLLADVTLFESLFHIAEDGPQVTKGLLSLLNRIPGGGKQIHDTNIVATMQAYGITHILTHNVKDFNRFSPLITVVPL